MVFLIEQKDLTFLRRLGEGSFATVDLCEYSGAELQLASPRTSLPTSASHTDQPTAASLASSTLVAVKKMKTLMDPAEGAVATPRVPVPESWVKNFRMETELLSTLRHPNIVACYGSVAVPEPDLHIVLEFCSGGTLRERISRGDYGAETALSWLLDVAKGCAFLHEHTGVRLAHRDIKPENLIISAEGTVKIADFGLCKAEIHPGTPAGVRVVHNLPRSSPPKTAYKVSRATVKPDDAEGSGHTLEPVAAKGRSATLAPPGSKAHVWRISRGWSARRSAEAERTSQQSDFSLRISAASVSSSGSAKSGRSKRASLQSVVNTSAWGLAFKFNMVGAQYVEMTGQTGSSLYMAPENYLRKPYTNKVDIFSFSIIMVEVLARRRAYEGLYLTPDMIAHAVAHKNLRPKIPSRWPANVQRLVRACWDEDPVKRPSSREIMRQLEHLIARGKEQPELLAALEARRPGGCLGGMFGAK